MGKVKIPESEYNNIIELYKQGWSQLKLAEKYNVSKDTIKEIFKKRNISRKDKPCRFSDSEIEKIKQLYNNGMTSYELGDIYNMSSVNMRRWLHLWGVEIRHTKYTFNEHYFDEIDNQDKAYIVGLLYADGYHNVKDNTISITLQEEDKHILESINILINSNRPLRFINNNEKNPNWKNCYQLSFTSPYVSNVLEQFGLIGAKSLVLEFPEQLDRDLYSHFIRGFFDGDGHISKGNYKYNMSIISTESFCSRVQKILLEELDIESHMYIPNSKEKSTRTLMITKKHLNKIFFDWLYKDANLYLKRKHDVYISKYCNNDINNTSINVAS